MARSAAAAAGRRRGRSTPPSPLPLPLPFCIALWHHGLSNDLIASLSALCDLCGLKTEWGALAAATNGRQRMTEWHLSLSPDLVNTPLNQNRICMIYQLNKLAPANPVARVPIARPDANQDLRLTVQCPHSPLRRLGVTPAAARAAVAIASGGITGGSGGSSGGRIRAALIDLNGTLHVGEWAIPGSQEALQRLHKTGVECRWVCLSRLTLQFQVHACSI